MSLFSLVLTNEIDAVLKHHYLAGNIMQFTASKDTLIHDFFNVMLSTLYANTVLAMYVLLPLLPEYSICRSIITLRA